MFELYTEYLSRNHELRSARKPSDTNAESRVSAPIADTWQPQVLRIFSTIWECSPELEKKKQDAGIDQSCRLVTVATDESRNATNLFLHVVNA